MFKEHILAVQINLAMTYGELGHPEKALRMERDVYSVRLKLNGEEHAGTLRAANNYATSLLQLQRFEEARSVLRKTMPVARRVLGDDHRITLKKRATYAQALFEDDTATLENLREAVVILEETTRIARRVLGGAHPLTTSFEGDLRYARAVLHTRETPQPSSPSGSV